MDNEKLCNYALGYGDSIFTYDFEISTEGFNIIFNAPTSGGGSGGNTGGGTSGNFNLKVTTNVAGVTTTTNIGVNEKPANQDQFCTDLDGLYASGAFVIDSCTFDGTTGVYKGSITSPGFPAINYTYTYVYSKN